MAPLSVHVLESMYDVTVRRSVGSDNSTHVAGALSPSQEKALQILALVFSVISVVSAILAGYWFTKMQRIFRHE
jgi:hypothetical protein